MSHPQGSPPTLAAARSSPVYTPTTPGAERACAVLLLLIRAWACGERKKKAHTCPGTATSSVNCPAPVRNRTSSLRLTDCPTNGAFIACSSSGVQLIGSQVTSHTSPFHRGGARLHRLYDIVIAGAAAEIAFEFLAYRFFGRSGMLGHQFERIHHHPRGAKAALQAMVFAKGRLHGVQSTISGDALDRHDTRTFQLGREHVARLGRAAVDVHGTRSALSGIAADVRAREPQALAQEFDQQRPRIHLRADGFSVDC